MARISETTKRDIAEIRAAWAEFRSELWNLWTFVGGVLFVLVLGMWFAALLFEPSELPW